MTRVILPWPPNTLWPNARVHWAKKAKAAKAYKNDCILSLFADKKRLAGVKNYLITFRVPDRRRRDLDNMIAAFKWGIDALSLVAGVDDSEFQLTFAKQGDPVKGGAVFVEAA